MAYIQALASHIAAVHQPYHNREAQSPTITSPMQPHRRPAASKQRFVAELSQCLFDFVVQLLPTQEEMAVKEDVRKLLERLIRTIEPDSRLLSFGSTANGFSLRNSDMDLCCLIDSEERLAASDLVTMLGDLLERETKFHVKPLPHARIPIVKLSLDPSPGLPLGIACDIGFENRLALENTRLLMCYAMIDPTRVRTMVLFLKVWSKRRKINSPYKGTLSSYGYVLLVIYFLVHVKNPPVLPNLQQMPPLRPISTEDTHLNGNNIWFFDDIDLLRQRWRSENTETVAELLIDFFRYYSRDYSYNTGVASIRAGLIKKDSKGWQNELSSSRYNDARERNRLCIEDPFEVDYNVARCVTRDGLYTIRGEFMRASRILAARPERAIVALADLCEERKDEELVSAPPYHSKPPTLPPQTPYTVGNQTLRPKVEERFSPPAQFFEPGPRQVIQVQSPVTIRSPPEHMAPKRGKWTSPPPPEAPPDDHTSFENSLGMGLQLATSSTDARETDAAYNSSGSNSEVFTDDGSDVADDDIKSVRSYTEGHSPMLQSPLRRPSWHTNDATRLPTSFNSLSSGPSSRSSSTTRGRFQRPPASVSEVDPSSPPTAFRSTGEFGISPLPPSRQVMVSSSSSENGRRSSSGPPGRGLKHPGFASTTPLAVVTPLPPSPATSAAASPIVDPRFPISNIDPANVYYQTTPVISTRSPHPHHAVYSNTPSASPLGTQQNSPSFLSHQYQFPVRNSQTQSPRSMALAHAGSPSQTSHSPSGFYGATSTTIISAPIPRDIFPSTLSSLNPRSSSSNAASGVDSPRGSSFGGPDTPTPATYHQHHQQQQQLQREYNAQPAQAFAHHTHTQSQSHVSTQGQGTGRSLSGHGHSRSNSSAGTAIQLGPSQSQGQGQVQSPPPVYSHPPRLASSSEASREGNLESNSGSPRMQQQQQGKSSPSPRLNGGPRHRNLGSGLIQNLGSGSNGPVPQTPKSAQSQLGSSTGPSSSPHPRSPSPKPAHRRPTPLSPESQASGVSSSSSSAPTSEASSPTPSSSSNGGYSTGISRSPSPVEASSPPGTALPLRRMEGEVFGVEVGGKEKADEVDSNEDEDDRSEDLELDEGDEEQTRRVRPGLQASESVLTIRAGSVEGEGLPKTGAVAAEV